MSNPTNATGTPMVSVHDNRGTLSGYAGVVHTVKKVNISSHSKDGKPHSMVSLPVSGGSEFFMRKSDARRTITM